MQRFNALAHIEIDHIACQTLRTRMRHYNYQNVDRAVLEMDITSADVISRLDDTINGRTVDVIIGGPPCQAYSSLGRAKDENGMKNDPRNYLFESYVKILNHVMPKLFVFENVTGILTATINGKHIINTIFSELGQNYDVFFDPKTNVLNSANYGVPQIRNRMIIIGVRKDLGIKAQTVYERITKTHYDPEMPESDRKGLRKYVTVRDAIEELPKLKPGEGKVEVEFHPSISNEFLKRISNKSDTILRDHVCRTHNAKDIERYVEMSKNHWTFQELLEHRPDLNHEKQRVFGNSYVVQWWDLPSKTIIAHLYKDGNQFIHPDYTQGRTFTVREAARIQSFPDNFVFEGSRTDQFKQIGNAVPPIFAEAIAKAIKATLKSIEDKKK